ncbi:DUF3077 domain-containing protein [Pseudomonas maioricensis]|uniref:DUF3077 domain-containing protein n=1 Tax=Pseudomonas maioricensis TaxID=1766623 RepID=UPI0030EE1072
MKQPHTSIKTLGTTTFSTCGPARQPLFRINPDIPIESALEHASSLLACIHELSLGAAMDNAGEKSVWAVHYLSDMAKAILDDALSAGAAKGQMIYASAGVSQSEHHPNRCHKQHDIEERTMGRTSNDDRSDSLNPNNDAYQSSMDNHSDQLNPNNERYQGTSDDEDMDQGDCFEHGE